MKSGAIRVINKPWDSDNLLNVVEKSLQLYRSFVERQKSMNRLKRMNENLD